MFLSCIRVHSQAFGVHCVLGTVYLFTGLFVVLGVVANFSRVFEVFIQFFFGMVLKKKEWNSYVNRVLGVPYLIIVASRTIPILPTTDECFASFVSKIPCAMIGYSTKDSKYPRIRFWVTIPYFFKYTLLMKLHENYNFSRFLEFFTSSCIIDDENYGRYLLVFGRYY